MKKLLLSLVIILTFGSAAAQNWCPPGAKWYIQRGGSPADFWTDGVIEMSYTTDTTVLGISCKRLHAIFNGKKLNNVQQNITETYNNYYTYESNKVIFLYNESSAFDTLVNFNALPGDQWLKPRSGQTLCVTRPVVTVTDTGHVMINGFYLKQIKTLDSATVLDWDSTQYTYAETEEYIERIFFCNGFLRQNLFQTNCEDVPGASDGPPTNVLKCYRDNGFPVYSSSTAFWSKIDCSKVTGIETIEKGNIHLSLYPNPNNGVFELEIQQPATIRILDMIGHLVYSESYSEKGKFSIDAVNISLGVYILKAETASGSGHVKFVRN